MDQPTTQPEKTTNTNKRIRLIARIISAPIIVYTLLMVIGYGYNWITTGVADPYAVEDYPWIENLPPLFMFGAIIGLAIAWFKEKIGSIINLGFCLLSLIMIVIIGLDSMEFRSFIPLI